MAKLKVFKTPIGFHDAYVAAPNMKAALAAWGTTKNLFARGSAEIVTDPDLMREPLAHPGQVFKLPRGSVSEQIAALPQDRPVKAKAAAKSVGKRRLPPNMSMLVKPSAPRPSRDALDRAEANLREACARQAGERKALQAEFERLEAKRRSLDTAGAREIIRLENTKTREAARYHRAIAKWRA